MSGACDKATEAAIELAAERASRETVRETFRLFGVDLDDQESVNHFRSDLVYARRLRRATERSVGAMVKVFAAAAAVGLIAAIGDYVQKKFGG